MADSKHAEISENAGDNVHTANASWTFSGDVVKTFDEHVRRSVPQYEVGHSLVCQLSDFFVQDDSYCYEIGCSTGVLLRKLIDHNAHRENANWIGIDSIDDMIGEAKKKIPETDNVSLEVADALTFDYKPADFIVSYYCIQFVQPKFRQQLIDLIYNTLNWGGAFVWFEKVRGADARFQDIMTAMYTDYKLEQGYSPDEIVAKSRSLKGRLEPFSTAGNMDLLKRAGFVDVITVFKHICFEGFLAIK